MIVGRSGVAQEMACRFAEMVRDEPTVQRLWVWSEPGYIDPDRDYVELWLLASPLDEAVQQRLSAAGVRLHHRFPDVEARLHLLDRSDVDAPDPASGLRVGAEEVALRPG